MSDHTDEFVWPEVDEPYASALRAAVEMILAHYTPLGVIASGSVLRGQGGPTSDLDIFVIHQAPFRQRLQRRFHNVATEIFVNPPEKVREYFGEEHADRRPITAHMLATGIVVLRRAAVVDELRNEAATWLTKRPQPTASQLRWSRYSLVDLLDNTRDVLDSDIATANYLLHQVTAGIVNYWYAASNRFTPRLKEILLTLHKEEPAVGELVQLYYETPSLKQRFQLVELLAHYVLGETTFFEWDSEPEPVHL
jgi:predicted nucleotidyltransferase